VSKERRKIVPAKPKKKAGSDKPATSGKPKPKKKTSRGK
jgi:hypothetical protein